MRPETQAERIMDSNIIITDEDKMAIERFIREDSPLGMKMMFGGDPAWKLAKAFAKHRIHARNEALREVAKIADRRCTAYENLAKDVQKGRKDRTRCSHYVQVLAHLATAIRNLITNEEE